jgi:hypothetical protein
MNSCMYSSPDINCNIHIERVGQGKLHTHKIETKHENSRNTRMKEIICKIKAFVIR